VQAFKCWQVLAGADTEPLEGGVKDWIGQVLWVGFPMASRIPGLGRLEILAVFDSWVGI